LSRRVLTLPTRHNNGAKHEETHIAKGNPMNSRLPILPAIALLAGWITTSALAAEPSGGQIDFGTFTPPAAGGEFVEVNIRSNLIAMAARLAEKAEPDAAEILRGVKQVRVNVVGLDDTNRADIEQRVKSVRSQLDTQGWERIVTAQNPKEDVRVYLKTRGDEAIEGLVVTVIDGGKEAVFINIVGDIRPEKIALLGEKFGIDPIRQAAEAIKKEHGK
jgi:hypothetical protein